jgi:hypothetical protein
MFNSAPANAGQIMQRQQGQNLSLDTTAASVSLENHHANAAVGGLRGEFSETTDRPVYGEAWDHVLRELIKESPADRLLTEMRPGAIAFNAPTEIRLDSTILVHLVLSPAADAPDSVLMRVVEGPGRPEVHRVQVGRLMEAELAGSDGLRIISLGPAQQPVSFTQHTEWTWSVRAVEAGTKRLYLTLSAVLAEGEREHRRRLKTFEKVITVDVGLLERGARFVVNQWPLFATGILFPLGGWFLGRWWDGRGRRRRRGR